MYHGVFEDTLREPGQGPPEPLVPDTGQGGDAFCL